MNQNNSSSQDEKSHCEQFTFISSTFSSMECLRDDFYLLVEEHTSWLLSRQPRSEDFTYYRE